MAARGTPHEREVARAKIDAIGRRPPPPRPPTAVGWIDPDDEWWSAVMGWSGAGFPTGTTFTAGTATGTVTAQRYDAYVVFHTQEAQNHQ